MSPALYRIYALLVPVLAGVPVGTNLALSHLLFALLSGHFLAARGAVFAALSDLGLPAPAVRRAVAALCYGHWQMQTLLKNWQAHVQKEGHFRPHAYEGFCPVACDTTGFLRPPLQGHTGKHYVAHAGKALPAVVVGLAVSPAPERRASVGSIGSSRFGLPRLLVRWEPTDKSEADLQKRLVQQVRPPLARDEARRSCADEVGVFDAGFALSLFLQADLRFVVRLAKNATARRNVLPAYGGHGRPAEYGEIVRPLCRTRAGKEIAATPPDAIVSWQEGRHTLQAHLWENRVLSEAKPGGTSFRCVAIFDPRYQEPLLLASNLPVSAQALWRLYRDRWAVETLPLAAKPMLGAERAFVFGKESCLRLPELALLAGNILTYAAALAPPVATGFWDRAARPTCGRLRRVLRRVTFSELPETLGQLRKKRVVNDHLPKGVRTHTRTKANKTLHDNPILNTVTGN